MFIPDVQRRYLENYYYIFLYTGSMVYKHSYFGTGIGPVIISNLYCSGSENNILDCSHNKINALTYCGVGQIAGLVCLGKLYAQIIINCYINTVTDKISSDRHQKQ